MNILAPFSTIKVFVLDIDGVLTNGQLLLQEDGAMLRSMSIKDGYALQLAVKNGYEIVALSGGKSAAAKIRLERLGLKDVFIAIEDKYALLKELIKERNWQFEKILYMGDDIPDWKAMQLCGLKTCPKDAVSEIKNAVDYVSPFGGGMGCVRDVIEKAMKIQGTWSNF